MLCVVIVTEIFALLRMDRLIELQTEAGRKDRWRDGVRDIVGEIVARSDPQINTRPQYGQVVSLIHRAQLMLDFDDGKEAHLNGILNEFGLALNSYGSAAYDAENDEWDRLQDQKDLLEIQGRLIDATKAVLGTGGRPGPPRAL